MTYGDLRAIVEYNSYDKAQDKKDFKDVVRIGRKCINKYIKEIRKTNKYAKWFSAVPDLTSIKNFKIGNSNRSIRYKLINSVNAVDSVGSYQFDTYRYNSKTINKVKEFKQDFDKNINTLNKYLNAITDKYKLKAELKDNYVIIKFL